MLHPGKTASLVYGDRPVGVIGEVHPRVLERFDLEGAPVALFEVDVESLGQEIRPAGRRHQGMSRFPEAHRDLALVVDSEVASATIQTIIESHKLVVKSTPFDVYTSHGVAPGKMSVAYRVVFQSPSSTLTSEEVDRAQDDILRRLHGQVGAELRG